MVRIQILVMRNLIRIRFVLRKLGDDINYHLGGRNAFYVPMNPCATRLLCEVESVKSTTEDLGVLSLAVIKVHGVNLSTAYVMEAEFVVMSLGVNQEP